MTHTERARVVRHLIAQGRVRPAEARIAVQDALRCSKNEAGEVLRVLANDRTLVFGWDGMVEVSR